MLRVDIRARPRVPTSPPSEHLDSMGSTSWPRTRPVFSVANHNPATTIHFLCLSGKKARGLIQLQIPQLSNNLGDSWLLHLFPQRTFGCHAAIGWPCNTSSLCRIFKIVPWPDITNSYRAQIGTLMMVSSCKAAEHCGNFIQTASTAPSTRPVAARHPVGCNLAKMCPALQIFWS